MGSTFHFLPFLLWKSSNSQIFYLHNNCTEGQSKNFQQLYHQPQLISSFLLGIGSPWTIAYKMTKQAKQKVKEIPIMEDGDSFLIITYAQKSFLKKRKAILTVRYKPFPLRENFLITEQIFCILLALKFTAISDTDGYYIPSS